MPRKRKALSDIMVSRRYAADLELDEVPLEDDDTDEDLEVIIAEIRRRSMREDDD